jgi:RES domain-containing protein
MIARQPIAIRKSLRTHRLSVQLSSVVDLRKAGQLSGHGYTAEIMTAEDWGPPQRLGGAAAWLGIGGLIVPSVRHPDGNLVIFVNNLLAADLVTVIHAGE